MRKPFEHGRHRLAHHVDHHQAGEQAGQQRNDQDRLQRFQAGGQARPAGNGLGAVTGKKARDDATDETGPQGAGQQATDHARRKPRAVGDGPGDVARQQRYHQLERSLATDLHQRRRQGARLFIRLDAEHERQGNQQPTGHHHGQHERHPGQQVLVHTGLLALCRTGSGYGIGAAFHFGFGQGLVQRGAGLLEGDASATTVDPFAGKPRSGHFDVSGQQHHIRLCDGLGRQGIARPDRTLGFHRELITHLLCRLLQSFCGHECVRDAGRASSDRNDSRDSAANSDWGV